MRSVLAVSAALLLADPASAGPTSPHPQPTAQSTRDIADAPSDADPARPDAAANAASRARMDAFDRRIRARDARATRAVCSDCAQGSSRGRAAGRVETGAEGPEYPIDDPAQAAGE